MLTIFNRALLLVDISKEELVRAKTKMKNAGISIEIKTRRNEQKGKSADLYAVYVRKCDYTEARKVWERG
ncbi:MAG: hypothetical protein Q4C01_02700 [Clostridia bacterium]|nr:hypothetical protein [Clostridia bacterium]